MEEQPKDLTQERQYHQQAEDKTSIQNKTGLKNDQTHFQYQHKETQAKKTGNRKLNNSDEEVEKNSHTVGGVGMSHPSSSNGSRRTIHSNLKQMQTQPLCMPVQKVNSQIIDHKKSMDLKCDKEKALDLTRNEGQHTDKKDSVLLPNGLNCGFLTNGYSNKQAFDNDSSSSEGGYTTPKKQKARCNSFKNTENVIREKERDMQQGRVTPEPGTCSPDTTEKGVNTRLETPRAVHKGEAQSAPRRAAASEGAAGDLQRKNSEGKALGVFGKKCEERHKTKHSSPSKEDSWTLFKPPPVFPVDNSSAKIVPKISYASKVKENLNKVAQTGGETLPAPVRLSQVPMSAMKTITSVSFTNGPVSGNGNGCPLGGTFFAPAAGSIPPVPSLPGSENVASPLGSHCSSATSPVGAEAFELTKCTLLIYPLNMQPVLPSARQLDPLAAQTNQKALGDIFQNQWGLSFINEPNLGPEGGGGGGGYLATEEKTTVAAHQGDRLPATAQAAQPVSDACPFTPEPVTFAQDPEKRTCASSNASSSCSPAPPGKNIEDEQHAFRGQEKKKVDAKMQASSVLVPNKDMGVKPPQGLLANLSFGASRERTLSGVLDRRCSWGLFDVKAAVTYHTKEIEYIFNLQKQDPKRVVVYEETKDEPDQ